MPSLVYTTSRFGENILRPTGVASLRRSACTPSEYSGRIRNNVSRKTKKVMGQFIGKKRFTTLTIQDEDPASIACSFAQLDDKHRGLYRKCHMPPA
jgi:hypothetical protein